MQHEATRTASNGVAFYSMVAATLPDGNVVVMPAEFLSELHHQLVHEPGNHRVPAIKLVRNRFGLSLKDAKDVVDAFRETI